MKTFCSYYNHLTCKSCSQIQIPYLEQVQLKNQFLQKQMEPLGACSQLPPIQSNPLGFRNKAKFSITGSLEKPIIGLTGLIELDQGREILNCPLHHPEVNKILPSLIDFIQRVKLIPYEIKSQRGELKGGIIYYSPHSQEMYLRLILRSKESLDRIRKHASHLLNQHSFITCFSANIQPIAHAILEGKEEFFFTSQDFINHQLDDISMQLHPQGFVQTNQEVALKLYQTAAKWVKEISPQTFVELYSGQGAFSFFIQKFVKKAVGIEINPQAVKRANLTAQKNKWDHLSFIAKDAIHVKEEVQKISPDLILVNPPRRGLGQAKLFIKELKPQYLIYSSCQAQSLIEDILFLKDDYQVLTYQLFDMFPHTDHFETLVMLRLIKK